MNHLRAVNFCFCTESNTFTQPSCPNTLLEGQRTRAEEKRWRDNEPAPVTAIGNQELTLWIIEAWQTRERERERKRDHTIALVSNPISLVHGVCMCVCLRFVSLGQLPLRAVKSNLESKLKRICVCVYHTMANLPSLRPSIHVSHSLRLCVFFWLAMHF